MYRGFQIKNTTIINKNALALKYDATHKHFLNNIHSNFVDNLEDFLIDRNIFNGETLMKSWFPSDIKFDIFISHSHRDETLVKAMAYKLKKDFGLRCFIDSCIWGYVEDLRDNIINYNNQLQHPLSEEQISQNIYIMLNSSLQQAMRNSECLFFLNTPNSILPLNSNNATTYSPWLLSEISMFNNMVKEFPSRTTHLLESNFSAFEYKLDLSGLINLTADDLNNWVDNHDQNRNALDELYETFPLPKRNLI